VKKRLEVSGFILTMSQPSGGWHAAAGRLYHNICNHLFSQDDMVVGSNLFNPRLTITLGLLPPIAVVA